MAYPDIEGVLCSEENTNVASATISLPSGATGELLLVVLHHGTRTATTPDGWALLATFTEFGTTGRNMSLYARIADNSEGSSLSVTFSATSRYAALAYRISGWGGEISTDIDVAVPTSETDFPALTTGWAETENLWFACYGHASAFIPGFTLNGASDYTNLDLCQNPSPTSTFFYGIAVATGAIAATSESATAAGNIISVTSEPENETLFRIVVRPSTTNYGIRLTGIKEPNESDALVTGVSNARARVWLDGIDEGAEDHLADTLSITAGAMDIPVPGSSLTDTPIVNGDWDAGSGETKYFRTTGTIIDLDA